MVEPAVSAIMPLNARQVGVLMLDTRFQRFPRDIGHAASLPFASQQRRVDGAVVQKIVTSQPLSAEVLKAFVDAGEELVECGVELITTSCGFLHVAQAELADALSVPVVSSSLLALPMLQATYGSSALVGVMTFDAQALGLHHSGAPSREPCVVGIERGSHFDDVICERALADPVLLERDVEQAADALAVYRPAVVLLECTNLAPWRHVVERVCNAPVVDLVDVLCWMLGPQT